ncbi:MAG: hypothetical protein ACOY0R_03980 [Chloroflexota bacterium]|jgi:hypothetical protein
MNFSPLPYLDPGSGSFILQIVIASLLGLGLALRASWSRIKTFFGVKPRAEEQDDEANDA